MRDRLMVACLFGRSAGEAETKEFKNIFLKDYVVYLCLAELKG